MASGEKFRLVLVDASVKDADTLDLLQKRIMQHAFLSDYDNMLFANQAVGTKHECRWMKILPVFSSTEYESTLLYKRKIRKEKLLYFVQNRFSGWVYVLLQTVWRYIRHYILSEHANKRFIEEDRMADELLKAMVKEKLSADDRLLFLDVSAAVLGAVLILLQTKYPCGDYPVIHLLLSSYPEEQPQITGVLPVGRAVWYLKLMGLVDSQVFLHAKNWAEAKKLSDAWGIDVTPLASISDKMGRTTFGIHLPSSKAVPTSEQTEGAGSMRNIQYYDSVPSWYNNTDYEAESHEDGTVLFVKPL